MVFAVTCSYRIRTGWTSQEVRLLCVAALDSVPPTHTELVAVLSDKLNLKERGKNESLSVGPVSITGIDCIKTDVSDLETVAILLQAGFRPRL